MPKVSWDRHSKRLLVLAAIWALTGPFAVNGLIVRALAVEPLPGVSGVDVQPLAAQVQRVAEALRLVGTSLTVTQQQSLDEALQSTDSKEQNAAIQAVLDPLCLAMVHINPESRVKAQIGPRAPRLVQHGWTTFLLKVHNEAGVTAELRIQSRNAAPLVVRSSNLPIVKNPLTPADVAERWLDVAAYVDQPLVPRLSGLPLEYRIVQLYARDAGPREAQLAFDVGQGTQDLGFRNELNVLFTCDPAVPVTLAVRDEADLPCMAHFEFRDAQGRLYPGRGRRLAPDLFFHDQIYRADGETVLLPPGDYEVTYGRGPEYRIQKKNVHVPAANGHREEFKLQRWIHLAKLGWFSGDHHVHAAGCAHYESPTEGVKPEDMLRHISGEDLNVGCVLSWGPCWYYQKQFFSGKVSELSLPNYLMRYDVEVSGFPSSHAGHLCLLRLKEDDYPGTTQIEQWPSWDLPVLQWGKQQGGVVGFSHSGWGLEVPATSLPTWDLPPFDGIGANEYIVDVTHDACDFISTVDTPAVWELNIWYHTLNCGYQCRISGETDFPCIYGERVGLGRSYVQLPKDQPLDYDAWVAGIKAGRCYVTDGLSHLVDFEVNGLGVGAPGDAGRASVLAIQAGEPLTVTANVAALLEEKPRNDLRSRALEEQPYWHVERARVADTRQVPVELIVNGVAVEQKLVDATGELQPIEFKYQPTQSSWVALRIFPSAHTNPVFVEVAGKPIRASKRSANWCIAAVEKCWAQKQPAIRKEEQAAAEAAYEHAKGAYRKILAESTAD